MTDTTHEPVDEFEVGDSDPGAPPIDADLMPHTAMTAELVPVESSSVIPAADELRTLTQLAVTMASSELVPKALRGKPHDVLLVMLTARDLGIALTTALRLCHPIDGQVTVAPKLKLAIVHERGIAKIWPDPGNGKHEATWYAVRGDMPEITFSSSYDWADAQRAELAWRDCPSADEHTDRCRRGQHDREIKTKCKINWFGYPGRMLSWRALGYLLDEAVPEVGTGLYSPDELGAVTDEEGSPVIDVTEVGQVDGMPEPERRGGQSQRRSSDLRHRTLSYDFTGNGWETAEAWTEWLSQFRESVAQLDDDAAAEFKQWIVDTYGRTPYSASEAEAIDVELNVRLGVEPFEVVDPEPQGETAEPDSQARSITETALAAKVTRMRNTLSQLSHGELVVRARATGLAIDNPDEWTSEELIDEVVAMEVPDVDELADDD